MPLHAMHSRRGPGASDGTPSKDFYFAPVVCEGNSPANKGATTGALQSEGGNTHAPGRVE
jgi:hypothetical protein